MDFDDSADRFEYKLTLNRYDSDFFRTEVQDTARTRPVPTLRSHKLIRAAREFFQREVSQTQQRFATPELAHRWGLRVSDVLVNRMSVVAVSSTDPDNAASVFETLNDRGIGLSTPDLLRNFLLRSAPDDDSRERIVSAWLAVLAVDEEASVERYLRHYWVSYQGDVKNRKLYREIKDRLTRDGTDPLGFSLDLAESAPLYRDLANAREDDPEMRRMLEAIKLIGAEPLYPALLAAYSHVSPDQDKTSLKALTMALIAMYVRSSVIGSREAGRIESTAFSTAEQLRRDGDFDAAISSLREFSPEPDEFVARFAHASISRRATARYLLREIEHAKRRTQEVSIEGTDRVHVEHIYPQQPLPGQRWPNHAAMINRLGNLTLMGRRLNAAVKNADFATKKVRAYDVSDVLMTRELGSHGAWDAAAINARQEELASWAFSIWHFPGEQDPGTVDFGRPAPEPSAAELPEIPDSGA